MDDKQRAEALWAYSITHERIMERLVRKGYFSQAKADVILDMLLDQISEESIESFSNSDGCKKIIASSSKIVSDGFISLTEIARTENVIIQAMLFKAGCAAEIQLSFCECGKKTTILISVTMNAIN